MCSDDSLFSDSALIAFEGLRLLSNDFYEQVHASRDRLLSTTYHFYHLTQLQVSFLEQIGHPDAL